MKKWRSGYNGYNLIPLANQSVRRLNIIDHPVTILKNNIVIEKGIQAAVVISVLAAPCPPLVQP